MYMATCNINICESNIFMQHSRLHTGAAGVNAAEFTSTCVHVMGAFPTSSKPGSQVYVAVSPTVFPVNVTVPFITSGGSVHRAVEKRGM